MTADHPSPIAGARIVRLKKVINARGHLQEIQRSDDEHFPGFAQAYVTCTLPGVTKAWYRHRLQFDQIALVSGAALVSLYDSREDSPTYRHQATWTLDEDSPGLVQIPPGVWHGFKAIGDRPLFLLHLNSQLHDPDHLDEERLPPDSPDLPHPWA